MKFMFRYVKPYTFRVIITILLKAFASFAELFMPYVLEYMLDTVAPTKNMGMVFACGGVMLGIAAIILTANIGANRMAVYTAKNCSYAIRKDLFWKSVKLSGNKFDEFGLPSITARMTSDSYHLQDFIRMFQSIGIRAPLMLIGGIVVSMMMDTGLGLILCIIGPLTVTAVLLLSFKGIPLYDKVQQSVDEISLVMRENITGIRVVKALSKEDYERGRFRGANETMIKRDRKAGTIMALPGPAMTLFLNIGFVLVVIIGAYRVNGGITEPGVILAFLTYFNMILMGAMGLSRVLLMMSRANASSRRIKLVVDQPEELLTIPESEGAVTDSDAFIKFDNVSFNYGESSSHEHRQRESFAGEERQKSLDSISFEVQKGTSLGIIGPTGCGKTTIINLLMRFYDVSEGNIFVDGKDIRTYDLTELRRKFGVVFQNDMVFADSIADNISFGRDVDRGRIKQAADDACASEFIEAYEDGYDHMSAAHGANFSGGQKQRILVSRALAANSEILVLDDSSSALDYKTDSALRKAIRDNYDSTSIIIAQRVSSIMMLDQIIVMDEGKMIGIGTHDYLMSNCKEYRDIYRIQMGEEV